MKLARLVLPLALSLAACSHNTISGTNIQDTPETRAVLDVFSKMKTALEARDADRMLSLVSESYFDPGDPSRGRPPMDYAALKAQLPKDFTAIKAANVEFTVKDVHVEGNKANVDFFGVDRYAVKVPSGEKWRSDSDDSRLRLLRVNGDWKIVSGL